MQLLLKYFQPGELTVFCVSMPFPTTAHNSPGTVCLH